MWVFKTKLKADGSIQRLKARLTAKGFTQVPGSDFDETYASVVSWDTLRILFATAAEYDMDVSVRDISVWTSLTCTLNLLRAFRSGERLKTDATPLCMFLDRSTV